MTWTEKKQTDWPEPRKTKTERSNEHIMRKTTWRRGTKEREENERDQNKTTLETMCSRAPSAFSIRPEVSSPKHSLSACPRASAPETYGEPPLAGVDLGPNHTHDLFLHLRLLGVDVGISYLAILIPAHTETWVDTMTWCFLFILSSTK